MAGPLDEDVTAQWAAAFDGEVVGYGHRGTVRLQGMSLARRSMLARGDASCYAGEEITLEMQLETRTIFVVARVDPTGRTDQCVLRFSVTSPEGNDLIARHVRDAVRCGQPIAVASAPACAASPNTPPVCRKSRCSAPAKRPAAISASRPCQALPV